MSLTKVSYSMITGAPGNVVDQGADSSGVADSTTAIYNTKLSNTAVVFPAGDYKLNAYPNLNSIAKTITGLGEVNLNWYYSSAIAWASFPTDTISENLRFICTEPYNGLRASIESADRVTLRNCHFEGFNNGPINDPSQDAWGLYIKTAKDALVDSCTFASSGNTDIAVVDDVDNLTIINPSNSVQGKVSLNVEPNSRGASTKGVYGMNVIGGRFNDVYLQEIENVVYASKDIVFSGSSIDTLHYDGAGVSFVNCSIASLTNAPDGDGRVYAGQLRINNAALSKNLIDDPYLFDVIGSGLVAYWTLYTSGGSFARQNDTSGKYLRLNTTGAAASQLVYPRNNISVTAGETLVFAIRLRVNNTGNPGVQVHNASFEWRDVSNNVISLTDVKCGRTLAGTNSGWHNDIAVVIPPANATQVRLYLGKGDSNVSIVDIAAVGLFRVQLNSVNEGNWDSVMGTIMQEVTNSTFVQSAYPTGTNSVGYFVGERVINSVPTVGQPKSWVCTVAGAPGTWVSEGNL